MCCDNQQIAQDNAALKAQLGAVMQQRQQQQQQEQGSGQQGVYG
jgi:hypothetical protein